MSILPERYEPNVTENRDLYIGGSDIPTILGLNKYKSQFELAQEKTGIKPSDFKGNEYTEFGNIMEPQIRDYINVVNETEFKEETKISENIRSNTDGFDWEHDLILEIKTHGKRLNIKPYIAQMQLYMWHFDVSHGWLAMYERPDDFDAEFDSDRLQIELIERDDEYVNKIHEAIDTFLIRCEYLKDNPNMTEYEFNNVGQNEVQVIVQHVEKLEQQLTGFKELEKQYKEAKQELHDKMEEYDVKKFDTDVVTITRVLPGTSKKFDSKTFKTDYPDLYSEYQKESERKGYVTIKAKGDK